ncbi:MAG TPA: isoaspartyl peptidase/L-asparaginase [Pirellulales bacterium]|nr:isoaspartyl peptidase/L-asparaginase [Pirellulales bacterium]
MADEPKTSRVVIGVHGGIGVEREQMTPELAAKLRAALEESLRAGRAALEREGATGLDGVEAAIRVLEDSPLFNAGKGAVFTHEGRNELDASIMEGKTLRAGAIASVTIIKNPITAARAVMEKSKHVLLVGRGAEVFATRAGLEIVDPSYFWTEPRWRDIQKRWEQEAAGKAGEGARYVNPLLPKSAFGTVGAVALDRDGNVAAGTSTGGMTNKAFGRVGDSPIIGAGTYADNAGAAVSCTGHGEFFIRWSVAHEVNALIKHAGMKLEDAAHDVIQRQLKPAGGEGGLIALDRHGRFTAEFNTSGMYRGSITDDGVVRVALYDD